MTDVIDNIIEELKTLNLLQASELVKKIEEVFNVDASAVSGGMMLGAMPSQAEPVQEEKTEFDIILESVSADKKIAVLKIVRSITGLGLKEAKELVESTPKPIKQGVPKNEADEIQKQIETAGGKITVK